MDAGVVEFLPTVQRVLHGDWVVSGHLAGELGRVGIGRPAVVLARSLQGTAVESLVLDALAEPPVLVFSGPFEHVPPSVVFEAAAAVAGHGADGIVAVGGGSTIDTAKALRYCLAAGAVPGHDASAALLAAMTGEPPTDGWLPMVTVPTTLSGAEYTRSFSATDLAAGWKRSVTASPLASATILYDPAGTVATPAELWLGTGVVALSHALEVLATSPPHPVGDVLKLEAAATLLDLLAESAAPDAAEARAACQVAAWLADHSPLRTRPLLGATAPPYSHLVAYDLAAVLGLGYGPIACVTLAPSLRLLAREPQLAERQGSLAEALGLDGTLPDAVETFVRSLGLPTSLRELGVPADDVARVVAAAGDRGVAPVEDLEALLAG